MKDNFTWREGRQKTGYERMKIFAFSWPFHMDCYILRIRPGGFIKEHVDPMIGKWRGKKHYRLNVIAQKPESGGLFVINGKSIFNTSRFKFFRPDVYIHSVTEVMGKRARYVLSFGFAI